MHDIKRAFPAQVFGEDHEVVLRLDNVAHGGVIHVVGHGIGDVLVVGEQIGQTVPIVGELDGTFGIGSNTSACHLGIGMGVADTEHVHLFVVYVGKRAFPIGTVVFGKLHGRS